MSVKAWIMFPKDTCCSLVKPGETLSFQNVQAIFHPSVESAIEEAKGVGEQTIISQIEIDDITCINALTAAMYGDSIDVAATLIEYFEYPFPYKQVE